MGKRKIWAEERVCFCGKKFMPEFSNQKYCCVEHSRAGQNAMRTKNGQGRLKHLRELNRVIAEGRMNDEVRETLIGLRDTAVKGVLK